MENNKDLIEKINSAFLWRAAVKAYDTEKKVDEVLLNTILEAGRMSPTAYGLQPFRILSVVNEDLRKKIQAAAFGQRQVVEAPHLYIIATKTNVGEEYVREYIELIAKERGVSVEDLKGFEDSMNGDISKRSPDEKIKWAGRQGYIAFGAMLETAALLGVDAGPMEGFIPAQVDEILDLKSKNLTATGLMVLGYRNNDEYSKMKKVRFHKEEMVIEF
jgi:nitroreductase/dihydropteridine reductase